MKPDWVGLIGRSSWLPLALVVTLLGCDSGPKPKMADADRARESLRIALEAWKNGETVESLKQRDPAIHFADLKWKSGEYKLLRYEIGEKDHFAGYELVCSVELWIEDAKGKTRQEKTTFSVGTHPVISVVRESDS